MWLINEFYNIYFFKLSLLLWSSLDWASIFFFLDIQEPPVCDLTSFCRMKMSIMTINTQQNKRVLIWNHLETRNTTDIYSTCTILSQTKKTSFRITEKNACITKSIQHFSITFRRYLIIYPLNLEYYPVKWFGVIFLNKPNINSGLVS